MTYHVSVYSYQYMTTTACDFTTVPWRKGSDHGPWMPAEVKNAESP
uniref:Uncharacterized protein n=1 Tax=Arundo donax TaxID=35708 RepID=A0A0A9CH57_ARUDO